MNEYKSRALVLLSGGLDSMLAVKVLQEQRVYVEAISFRSNFYGTGKAEKAAANLGIKINIIDFSPEFLEIVKHPASGHGKHMNPCIDCHAYMIRRANEFAREHGFDFVATGEVLGQRPMSQNKIALGRVQNISGGEVLRPLSAKLLPETKMEQDGLVDRDQLLDISGRSRDRQMALAEKYGITDYPSPGGGCVLTEADYSKRLKEMLDRWPEATTDDVALLKHGRIFWFRVNPPPPSLKLRRASLHPSEEGNLPFTPPTPINPFILLVIGRNQEDNDNLIKLAKTGDIVVELKEEKGPLALLRLISNFQFPISNDLEILVPEEISPISINNVSPEELIDKSCEMVGYYAPKLRGKKVGFKISIIK